VHLREHPVHFGEGVAATEELPTQWFWVH
jgi:hypothetical protein